MRRVGAYAGVMALLVASAQSMVLTLSAVEMITSFAVPLSCIFAYNTPIDGCYISDFTGGQCSSNCQRALQRVETNIRASCDTVNAQPNSLIWEAQRGNLVNALSPAYTFVEIGDFDHHYRASFVEYVFRDAFVHSHDVDDYTDIYVDDNTNDRNDGQLDDQFKL